MKGISAKCVKICNAISVWNYMFTQAVLTMNNILVCHQKCK